MGIDLTLAVQFRDDWGDAWSTVLTNPYLPNDYNVFGYMTDGGIGNTLVEGYTPRGLPPVDELDYETFHLFHLAIADTSTLGRTATPAEVKEWKAETLTWRGMDYAVHPFIFYKSHLSTEQFKRVLTLAAASHDQDVELDKATIVRHALMMDEEGFWNLEKVLSLLDVGTEEVTSPHYRALLAYMQAFEYEGRECRIVFGFSH